MAIKIFCSGGIKKGDTDSKKLCWGDTEKEAILKNISSLYTVEFLNPDDPITDLSNSIVSFGRDMYQVQLADFVVVDARERRGVGVGTEMVCAKLQNKPLLVVIPCDSHYRKTNLYYRDGLVENYIHPHIESLADAILSSFETVGMWITRFLETPVKIKNIDIINHAIDIYKTTQASDKFMTQYL